MSADFKDAEDREFSMNAWNWGVLHYIVAEMNLFPDDVWAPKRHAGGGDLDAAQVADLLDLLEHVLLPMIPPGHRMFFDLQTTDVPDDGKLYRGDEIEKNYSLRNDVLVAFIAYLHSVTAPLSFS